MSGHKSQLFCKIINSDSRFMDSVEDDSVNLIITSPPYFNTKDYSGDYSGRDLGNIDDYKMWRSEIAKVWSECYRVLQPGRKLFINIMNLPLSPRVYPTKRFRSLNIVGHTIDACEELGFIFKREIIWHKTNSVRAHFGTYPYPGGILINMMHEQILEFEKGAPSSYRKYKHISAEVKEASKLSKEFWLSVKKSSVWKLKPYSSRNRKHLAPFPVELPSRLIRAYSYLGEIILDPFGGHGTTAIAALTLGRNAILQEINKEYVDLTLDNLKSELNLENVNLQIIS